MGWEEWLYRPLVWEHFRVGSILQLGAKAIITFGLIGSILGREQRLAFGSGAFLDQKQRPLGQEHFWFRSVGSGAFLV